ncbi:Methylated-DNA--protein-cysteine methyltransferase, constitutive [Corynebacterium capitovis DSM 44611]|uniref:methylated-DNA--[protein]-cysteine S-methyltransferase n=1 Tax=Corynebacterium capitovis TaxID=131081 RepID=UPI00058C16FD|nr:methylated-DNA--[protein]-cysteine S-methyltransferase [Corynebacterium capitovis]WKD57101.1 Methylated-DNA--protein-cysteine methyltransferase, constitutive [Corynebacterium capitovis DSM 44611]
MGTLTWTFVNTPIGELVLVSSAEGLARVAFGRVSIGEDLPRADNPEAARQLGEYFAGERRDFELPLDWRLSTGFRRTVQAALLDIPYGGTETYLQLATRIGRPGATRAVGTGCARNPLPVVVPCHRVTRSDGTLGGYAGGVDAKKYLLELEARHALR